MTNELSLVDIDAWALTHPGKVRKTNEDHYFVGALAQGLTVYGTSLGDPEELFQRQRLATLGVVADGVGGSLDGEEAARTAVLALVREVTQSFLNTAVRESKDPEAFSNLLQDAALACHESLLKKAEEEDEGKGRFATTLTFFLGLWPHAYLLQVGDSRCYIYDGGKLTQVTRDQTWAQELIDSGTLSQTKAHSTRWSNILLSSIGGPEAAPVVTRIERNVGAVILMCSDGLTAHVSDERIREHIESMTDCRQLCEALLQDALDGGGLDNITIASGRTVLRED